MFDRPTSRNQSIVELTANFAAHSASGFLNLELGIMHQDIAPRNLLIDPGTDKIILFDFDWAANGKEVYEIVETMCLVLSSHFTRSSQRIHIPRAFLTVTEI